MNKQETTEMLSILSLTYANFEFNDAVVNAWYYLFQDEQKQEAFTALKTWIKTSASSFPPTPSDIFGMINKIRDAKRPQADELFDETCYITDLGQQDPIAAKVWKLWGGLERWKLLPDPANHHHPSQAARDLNFARKELLHSYENHAKSNTLTTTARPTAQIDSMSSKDAKQILTSIKTPRQTNEGDRSRKLIGQP